MATFYRAIEMKLERIDVKPDGRRDLVISFHGLTADGGTEQWTETMQGARVVEYKTNVERLAVPGSPFKSSATLRFDVDRLVRNGDPDGPVVEAEFSTEEARRLSAGTPQLTEGRK